jgi:hypothetical protein
MNNQYYILVDNEQSGPFSYDELTEMELDVHTRVLSPLADTWQDACDLPEFYPYFESRGIYLPTGDNLASFGWRFLAYVIDYVILSFLLNFILRFLASNGLKFNLGDYNDLLKMPVKEILLLQLITSITLVLYP